MSNVHTYTYEELIDAYTKWVNTRNNFDSDVMNYSARNEAWDSYCDIRDGRPPGTSKKNRLKRESSRFAQTGNPDYAH